MAFDYKKEYKEFYLPPRTPGIVTLPAMNFLAVRGQGDPNEEHGAYKQALEQLYAVAYTIKMSKRNPPEGYFDYVVPPLEGLWWQEGVHGVDYARKADFQWISLIRLPEFVTKVVFDQAVREATEKKQRDFSQVEFFPWEEGLCVQCMHIGPYDDEPATAAAMEEYARRNIPFWGNFSIRPSISRKAWSRRPGPWWIGRSCRSILRASAHVPATIVWLLRLEEKW